MTPDQYYNSELLFDTGYLTEPPLFSVCLSTYNFSSCVTQALQTLLNQTFSDYEIVIHDDGSKDDTCRVVLNFLKNRAMCQAGGKRVRLYSAFENGGILTNRLRAFAHSDGKWLIQTDGDDFSPNDRLEKIKAVLDSLDHEPMLLATNKWVWKEGMPFDEVPIKALKSTSQINRWIKLVDIVNQSDIPNGSSGFVLNRKVFETFYGSVPQVRIIADDPVLSKRALLIGDAYTSDIPVYYCRVSGSSASGGGVSGKKWILDRYNRLDLLYQDIAYIRDDHTVPEAIQKGIDKWKKRMLLDSKLIDCSNFVWPFHWIKMIFISPKEAKLALKKRIKLILFGNVNADFKRILSK